MMTIDRVGSAVVNGQWALVADIDVGTGSLGFVRSVPWSGVKAMDATRVQSVITHDGTGRAIGARPRVAQLA
jgi:hypothetical protein